MKTTGSKDDRGRENRGKADHEINYATLMIQSFLTLVFNILNSHYYLDKRRSTTGDVSTTVFVSLLHEETLLCACVYATIFLALALSSGP